MAIPAVVGKQSSSRTADASNPPSRRARTLLLPLSVLLVFSALSTSQSMLAVRRTALVTKPDGGKYYANSMEAEEILSIPSTDERNSSPAQQTSLRQRILSDDRTFDKAETPQQQHQEEEEVDDAQQATENASSSEQMVEEKQVVVEEEEEEAPVVAADEEAQDEQEEVASSETHDDETKKEEERPAEQNDSESLMVEEQQEEVIVSSEEQKEQQQTDDSEVPPSPNEEHPADAEREHKKPRFVLHVGPMKTVRT